jgi:hypothetical protein
VTAYTVRVQGTDSQGHATSVDLPITVTAAVRPLLGAGTSSNTTWSTLTAAVGQFQARRTYEGGGSALPTSFSGSRAASDLGAGRATYASFKPNQDGGMATFATSTIQQNWCLAYLRSVPVGHRFNVSVWHEPGDNFGSFTVAQWKAGVVKLGQLVAQVNAEKGPSSRLRSGPIIEGPWDFDSTNTSYGQTPYGPVDWRFTAAELQWIDFIGIDPYIWKGNDVSLARQLTYDDMGRGSGQTRACMTYLVSMGKPVVLGEWGVTSNDQSDADKAAEIRAAWDWMKAWTAAYPGTAPIEAALYFHYNLEADVTWEVLGVGEELAKQALIDILADARG